MSHEPIGRYAGDEGCCPSCGGFFSCTKSCDHYVPAPLRALRRAVARALADGQKPIEEQPYVRIIRHDGSLTIRLEEEEKP